MDVISLFLRINSIVLQCLIVCNHRDIMKLIFLLFLQVLFIATTMQSCQRKTFDSSKYWERELPGIIADTSRQFYADTLIKNTETALAIAEPILASKYGQSKINRQKPLKAIKVDNFWIVDGTLPSRFNVGGTATVILRATDGKVILLTHYK